MKHATPLLISLLVYFSERRYAGPTVPTCANPGKIHSAFQKNTPTGAYGGNLKQIQKAPLDHFAVQVGLF
jgi:hypothetical protein